MSGNTYISNNVKLPDFLFILVTAELDVLKTWQGMKMEVMLKFKMELEELICEETEKTETSKIVISLLFYKTAPSQR